MPKISVVMPCLNMEKYIEKCLDSVIGQTLDNLEIILVDAGSQDKTREIIERYAGKDDRIKLIHSDRRSYGYQVNLGISLSCGEYIGIVDTDDYMEPNAYEILYQKAKQSLADYVKGTAKGFYSFSNQYCYEFLITPYPLTQYPDEGIKVIPKEKPELITCDNFLWNGIYRSDFLKAIKLNESNGAAFQDFGALFQIQTRAKNAIYVKDLVYHYRQDNIGSSTSSHQGFRYVSEEYANAEKYLAGVSEQWRKAFYRKLFLHFMDRLYFMVSTGSYWDDAKSYINDISEQLRKVVRSGLFTEKDLLEGHWKNLQLFFYSPYELYQKYKKIYDNDILQLRNIVQKAFEYDCVLVGCGMKGDFLCAQLLSRNLCVKACCDNKKSLWGKQLYGIKIISPKEAAERFPDVCYIVTNKRYSEELSRQLKGFGVKGENILAVDIALDIGYFKEFFW